MSFMSFAFGLFGFCFMTQNSSRRIWIPRQKLSFLGFSVLCLPLLMQNYCFHCTSGYEGSCWGLVQEDGVGRNRKLLQLLLASLNEHVGQNSESN
ncbi:hypothetical protein BR93DRAFT_625497 [Coniochaeta sp. PMI_546]|nr:hypothetical protein BR93DRAFT_625497 [Coniochaeta sp. PMI_546]